MSLNNRKKFGGEVIGAGGFGCVFKPALKCNNSKKRTNGVSKLTSNKISDSEWNEIQEIKRYIEKIPNYENFFLINNLNKCKPSKLSDNDKKNLKICNTLENKFGINADNINNNLDKLKIINMPYGGNSLNFILSKNIIPIFKINILLLQLLVYGIIPMNNLNLYHFDIKADNILYKNNFVRIIDFGEMGISTSK